MVATYLTRKVFIMPHVWHKKFTHKHRTRTTVQGIERFFLSDPKGHRHVSPRDLEFQIPCCCAIEKPGLEIHFSSSNLLTYLPLHNVWIQLVKENVHKLNVIYMRVCEVSAVHHWLAKYSHVIWRFFLHSNRKEKIKGL